VTPSVELANEEPTPVESSEPGDDSTCHVLSVLCQNSAASSGDEDDSGALLYCFQKGGSL
jgi:hypothetical protein